MLVAGWLGAASAGRAQSPAAALDGIPSTMYPPPGACRVWVDGVPPEQQPPPLDCADAQRVVPPNGRVVFGVTARRPDELAVAGGVDRRPEGGGVDRRPAEPTPTPIPVDPNTVPGPRAVNACPDVDGNGWCDDVLRLPAQSPAALPRMLAAVLYQRAGRGTPDVAQWLGGARGMRVRFVDDNRDNVPEQVLWLDQRGAPLQIWADVDGDGVADQIGAYRGARVARVVGRR
jgi:hypothetical protein